jgi:hypothetical protein
MLKSCGFLQILWTFSIPPFQDSAYVYTPLALKWEDFSSNLTIPLSNFGLSQILHLRQLLSGEAFLQNLRYTIKNRVTVYDNSVFVFDRGRHCPDYLNMGRSCRPSSIADSAGIMREKSATKECGLDLGES